MRAMLKTTTALFASLSLAIPAPLFAQEGSNQEPILCADGSAPPCPEGDPANELLKAREEAAAAAAAAEAEAKAAQEAEAAAAAEAEAQAAQEAEAAAAEAEAKAAQEAEAAAAAEAEAKAAQEAEAAAAAEAEAKAAQEAEAAAAEAEAKAAQEAEAAAAAEAEAKAAQEAEAAAAAEAEAKAAQEAEAAAAAEAEARAAQEAEAAAAAEAEAKAAKEAEAATAAEAEAPAKSTEEPAPAEEPVTAAAEEAASGVVPEAAALAVMEDSEAAKEAGTVVEEVVTEETARSSAEDFDTKVSGAPAADKPKREGLSDFEKALLIGVGVVAVGAILSNNRRVELSSGDRVVVTRDDGSYEVLKDDNALLRQPGSRVETRTFDDGSTLTTVWREDGSRIVTIRDPELRVLRRVRYDADGTQTILIDDTYEVEPVDIRQLPQPVRQPDYGTLTREEALRAALERETAIGRSFSLAQVRAIPEVRALVPVIDLDAITFDTGSSAIEPDQARALADLGSLITDMIARNPREIFLIEGHTDAIGKPAANLALSDRRAESVALALTEYFGVPPENLVVQGYGESFLKIKTEEAERANRRVSVRRITDLLRSAAAE